MERRVFKILKGKKALQPRILCPARVSFRIGERGFLRQRRLGRYCTYSGRSFEEHSLNRRESRIYMKGKNHGRKDKYIVRIEGHLSKPHINLNTV